MNAPVDKTAFTAQVKVTYNALLGKIRTNRSDPMAGIGRWDADEELANDIYKMIKLAHPERVEAQLPSAAQDAA